MEHNSLLELIEAVEYGTKMHICVVFLSKSGNRMTQLPRERVIHSKPYCQKQKETPQGLARCFSCRNRALEKAMKEKRPFGGFCVNGVYEICHPVLVDGKVRAVIFLGNLMPRELGALSPEKEPYAMDFEREASPSLVEGWGTLIERHVRFLLLEYDGQKNQVDPLVENVKNYVEEGVSEDVLVSKMASFFHYNEKYIGKYFKKKTGETVKAYTNRIRLSRAQRLLEQSTLAISEIALQSGFRNVSYFNRCFRKKYGCTPGEWRRAQPCAKQKT